jgi:hypothetical protein
MCRHYLNQPKKNNFFRRRRFDFGLRTSIAAWLLSKVGVESPGCGA